MITSSFDDAVATTSVCTTYVVTSLVMLAKRDVSHSLFQIYLTSLAERGRGSTLVVVFPMMRCGWSFSDSWPLALLLDTIFHHHVLILLVVINSHQLVAPGALPFSIRLISGCSGETGLFLLSAKPSPSHLPNRFTMLSLPNQHSLPLLTVPTGPHHLLIQPGPPHLPIQPVLLHGRTGPLLCSLKLAGFWQINPV